MTKIDNISDFTQYRDEAHMKYEIIRPVLMGQITAKNRARKLQLHEKTLAKYLRHFRNDGYIGLLDQRHKSSGRKEKLSETQKAQMIIHRLVYDGFSLRELAAIVGEEYGITIDHKSVSHILQQYEALLTFSRSAEAIEHILIRFRTYREYTPNAAGRYRIIEQEFCKYERIH